MTPYDTLPFHSAARPAYLDALALCDKENVTTLWVHDPLSLFPLGDRPEREV